MIRARLDCFIYFHVREGGGFYGVKLPNGQTKMLSTLTTDERLNFPSASRVQWANRRVRIVAPGAASEYRFRVCRWREARKRYLATRNALIWQAYVADKNYKTVIALARRGGLEHYRRYVCPYLVSELKPRMQERRRAYREMKAHSARIKELRVMIFEAMGVPEGFREYA
jgi:hypothetical protein